MKAEQLNALNKDQIIGWLESALRGQAPLPRLTPDESHCAGIIRMEKSLNAAGQKSLREGALHLLQRFCDSGSGNASYVQELLSLASALRQPQTPDMLADFALRFPERPELRIELRYAVLGLLVDAPQPRTVTFWKRILKQDPEHYSGPCFLACSLQDRGSPSRCFPRCRRQSVTVWPRPSNSTSLGTTCRRDIGRGLSSKCRISSASADPNLRVRSKDGRMVASKRWSKPAGRGLRHEPRHATITRSAHRKGNVLPP